MQQRNKSVSKSSLSTKKLNRIVKNIKNEAIIKQKQKQNKQEKQKNILLNSKRKSSNSLQIHNRQRKNSYPQSIKNFDKNQFFSQSIAFVDDQNYNSNKKPDITQETNKSPSFQRSSLKRTQKMSSSIKSQSKLNKSATVQNQKSIKPQKTPIKDKKDLQVKSKSNSMKIKSRQITPPKQKKNKKDKFDEDQWLKKQLQITKNQAIKKIDFEFTNQIQKPLLFQKQMSSSAFEQRCLQHNNVFSLYCSIDRQLLCVGCIYQTKTHKNHRITPLTKSFKQITEDIQGFKNRIQETIQLSDNLVRQSNLNLVKVQKQYPALVHKVQTYYYQIHQLIEQKKKQQLQYLQTLRVELRTQCKVISTELNKINNFISQKLRQIQIFEASQSNKKSINTPRGSNYQEANMQIGKVPDKLNRRQSNRSQDDTSSNTPQILMKRCGYQALSKYYKILNQFGDALFDEKKDFEIELNNFYEVLDFIKYKLTMIIPVMKKHIENKAKRKSFTNMPVKQLEQKRQENMTKQQKQTLYKENQPKQTVVVNNENNDREKELNRKKGFSTSPQVPKGLSRRFIQVVQPKYSPKKLSKNK